MSLCYEIYCYDNQEFMYLGKYIPYEEPSYFTDAPNDAIICFLLKNQNKLIKIIETGHDLPRNAWMELQYKDGTLESKGFSK